MFNGFIKSCVLFAEPIFLAACVGHFVGGARMRQLPVSSQHQALHFDDMMYSPSMHRVLVPAAQSGALVLINPSDQALEQWPSVVPVMASAGTGRVGATSAAVGDGLVFVNDHARHDLVALDPHSHRAVAHVKLASDADYVRYVPSTHQVWVTEPRAQQIERFNVIPGAQPALIRAGVLSIPGGPESLVIDNQNGVAYTNLWKGRTLQISLHRPQVTATWPNACKGGRGLALAPRMDLLFVGCKEGKVVALQPSEHGRIVSLARVGPGVDIIAWNAHLRHLYAPGAANATLSVLSLGKDDALNLVATVPTAPHAHCVATDGRHHAYVCDPANGSVLVYTDH